MTDQLNVAIATWKQDGIVRVADMNLPKVRGVHYVISWQDVPSDYIIPETLADREDVTVHIFNGKGVSANRNNACKYCSAPIILMGDDDLIYTEDGLAGIVDIFAQRPEMSLAVFKYDGPEKKRYPDEETILTQKLPTGFSVSMVEIAVRKDLLKSIKFDELFGPGAPVWQAAEDQKFLHDAIRAGLQCRFIPYTITTHPHKSTGSKAMTPGVAAASGRFIRLEYPVTWVPRLILKAWRERNKQNGCVLQSLYYLFKGSMSASR